MSSPRMERTNVPGVYLRGSRYVIVWRDRGKQKKEFFPTKALAREAKRRRDGGDRRKRPRLRLRDYADKWISTYRGRTSRGFAESTRTEYRRDLNQHVLPYFGGWLIDSIESPDVRDWFAWMEQRGVSVSSIRKTKATLSALMATAKEDGAVRHNAVTGVRYVPSGDTAPPRTLRPLTLAELDRFMRALPREWTLFFGLLAHTGLRVGELLGLRWVAVHLADDPHLTITEQVYEGKRKSLKSANAYRRIPLSPDVARALVEWRTTSRFADDADPVFASTVGTPLSYSNVWNRVLDPARKVAGIPAGEVGAFHAFRRTLASVAHQSGLKTDRQICDWLGHHDPAFTVRTYVGTVDQGVGDAGFLDELIPVNIVADGPTND